MCVTKDVDVTKIYTRDDLKIAIRHCHYDLVKWILEHSSVNVSTIAVHFGTAPNAARVSKLLMVYGAKPVTYWQFEWIGSDEYRRLQWLVRNEARFRLLRWRRAFIVAEPD